LFDILKLIARLIIICKKIRPEIIHSNGIKSHVISGAAGIFTGIKPFFHIRDITSFPADFIIAFTALLSKGTLIFNSRASRKNFLKLPSLFKNIKKYVIYNGIETDNIDHFKKNKLNTKNKKETKSNKNNRIIFFSMGHLAPLKGYDILIKAFALFLKNQNSQKQDAILIIAGGEPYKTGSGIHKGLMESLKNLAKKEGVYNQVRFMGQVDNPSRLFKIADIFVLASLSEGFGRVNAEAMANGLPVISSCTGGIPEVVKNGITGFLCRPGDIMDFSEKMKILANNPDLRIQLGRAGQKRVKKFFSLQTSIDKIHTVWNLGDIND
jgi:glycosyltransferase involved in cell wall biosynthesis